MSGVTDRQGNPFPVSFDPHDTRYYHTSSPLHKILKNIKNAPNYLPEHVKLEDRRERVRTQDDHGDESVVTLRVPYLTTFKEGKCDLYEEHTDTK